MWCEIGGAPHLAAADRQATYGAAGNNSASPPSSPRRVPSAGEGQAT